MFGALLVSAPLRAAPPDPQSGEYGPLLLAVRGGAVSGAFSAQRRGNGTASAPQFSCAFLLRGRLWGNQAAIVTWYPGGAERIPGQLTLDAGSVSFSLTAEHDGCAMTEGDMVRHPMRLQRDRPGSGWRGVALVGARRTVLRASVAGRPLAVLPRTEAVAVLARRSGWTRVVLARGRGRGWVPAPDLAQVPFGSETTISRVARSAGRLEPE